jgi:hypothetical protein
MTFLAVIFTDNPSVYLLVSITALEGYCDIAFPLNMHVVRSTVLDRAALLPRETLQSATAIAAVPTEA